MDFEKYYIKNKTYITFTDIRLEKIVKIIKELNPSSLLDIGCGSGYLLDRLTEGQKFKEIYGVDVYSLNIKKTKWKYERADITKGLPFKNSSLSCVVLGEVIEHVPNPDFLLREIRRILKRNGTLIISTPNLVSWMNRILVLFGIQPLYTETSSEVNLGRFLKLLGQGSKTQGHLKIFTYKSLEEILIRENFEVKSKIGVPFFFPFPISLIDNFFTNFISVSSGLLFVCKKNKGIKNKML